MVLGNGGGLLLLKKLVIESGSCFHGLVVISDVVMAPIDELMNLFGRSTHELVDLDMSD